MRLIKLYFMVGLPTETDQDLKALVDLVHTLRRIKGLTAARPDPCQRRHFIPKPHTPFQWAPRRHCLKGAKNQPASKAAGDPGGRFQVAESRDESLEGVWARGDRRLGNTLRAAHRRGCRFDGWGDQLKFNHWMEAFAETDRPGFFTRRERELNEPLPGTISIPGSPSSTSKPSGSKPECNCDCRLP